MATKRNRANLQQFIILIIAVVLVVAASIGFQTWWNNRPGTQPHDVTLKATSGGQEITVPPFSVCEIGTTCEGEEVPELKLQDSLHITLPKEIYDHDWRLLKIYDDPEANHEEFYTGHEKTEVDIAATTDAGAKLTVVEVSTALIGTNPNGEESPYAVVWSIKLNQE
ncbi:DUF2771 domain-containing protein [Corynebacterium freiburgense]|uniref:DUF2771 domain-containing protein n=1 Tax=Corynebacterium freiburgense TaxID=556548 RepID=UPI0003FE8BF0|nr:DUF2771 domain-containing protein [Corynebacterium freiburgense]WJZ02010.1 hypothetical protein CFREI_03550 [Corynebacterium freiburgense]